MSTRGVVEGDSHTHSQEHVWDTGSAGGGGAGGARSASKMPSSKRRACAGINRLEPLPRNSRSGFQAEVSMDLPFSAAYCDKEARDGALQGRFGPNTDRHPHENAMGHRGTCKHLQIRCEHSPKLTIYALICIDAHRKIY